MQAGLYLNNKWFTEKEFSKGKELEELMVQNSKNLFGQHILPVSIKCTSMVAQIAPHFEGVEIPAFGKG